MTVNDIRHGIQVLYRTNQDVHVSVSTNRPKINIKNQKARINAVYPNVFVIESNGKLYTAQYVELITKDIQIPELWPLVPSV